MYEIVNHDKEGFTADFAEGSCGSGVLVPAVLSYRVDCFRFLCELVLYEALSDAYFASFSISSNLSLKPDT